MHLETLDLAVVAVYAVSLMLLAQWVSREKAGHQKDTKDYFLAGRALPWWAIGASLIAANISAEQIIGMSGSAYVLGIAIASYEWMAAITLIIVGKYLLPVFLKHKIYTMPQFLEQRYDSRVKTVLAFFWLGVYVFVNLTSILWLGSLAINTVTGMAIDAETRRPVIGNVRGGLSGPAIKPIALLKVSEVHEVAAPHRLPIIGQGGIRTATDAIEFIVAGASAVGVGTALFYDPLVCKKINAGIADYLERHGFDSVADLVGTLQT